MQGFCSLCLRIQKKKAQKSEKYWFWVQLAGFVLVDLLYFLVMRLKVDTGLKINKAGTRLRPLWCELPYSFASKSYTVRK